MGGKSPSGQTATLEYNGAVPLVHNFNVLNGATTASAVSNEFIAPFAFKIKEFLANIHDGLSATTAIATVKRNGTAIMSKSLNALATGMVDLKSGSTTTFSGTDYLVNRGDRIKVSLPNIASIGIQAVMVGNPM